MTAQAAYAAAIVSGAVVWLAISIFGGRREAWDSPLYWLLGYPAALIVAGVLGYLHPQRAWRWPLAFMWTQAAVMAVTAASFGLLPLGLILFAILGVPPMLVAVVAARLRRRALIAILILFAAQSGFAQQPEVAIAIAFTEGPTVDAEGNVYFTDLVWQKILKVTPGGVLTTFREQSNNANGLLIDPQGRLIACEGADSPRRGTVSRFRPQVTRTDLRTGVIEVLADSFQGQAVVGPNDVTIDSRGRLYFTDLPGGAVYRIDGPKQISRILTRPDIERPNGIQISPDDGTLYQIEANPLPRRSTTGPVSM